MSSTSESGHALNLASFASLIVFVNDCGPRYAPNRAALQLAQLQTLYDTASTTLSEIKDRRAECKVKITDRQLLFAGLKGLSTRIISALQANNINSKIINDAKTYHRKIHGRRATSKSQSNQTAEETEAKQISVSQQSFTQQVQHFENLISIIKYQPNYNPSEPDLQIPNLIALKNEFALKTKNVLLLDSQLNNIRKNRDAIFYNNEESLFSIASDVKAEIKSIYGASSPEFKTAAKIIVKKLQGKNT